MSKSNKIKSILALLVKFLPSGSLFKLTRVVNEVKLAQMLPEQRMAMLLDQHNNLHNQLAHAGVDLGAGKHVKHRLTKYHDFFVENISDGDLVLDVGCGIGEVAATIARRKNVKVIGIDFDEERLELARKNCEGLNVELISGDAAKVNLPDGVNLFVLSNVLEHIEKRPEFVRRIFDHSNATKGLIRVPIYERDWTVPLKQEMGIEWRLDTTHFIEFTTAEFEKEMDLAGCKILSLQIRWSEIWAIIALK